MIASVRGRASHVGLDRIVVDVHGDHQRAATHGVRIGVGVRAMLFMRLLAEQRFEEVRDPGLVMRAIQRAVGGGIGGIVGVYVRGFGAHGMYLLPRNAPRHQVSTGAVGVGQRCERCYQGMSHDSPHVVLNNRVCRALRLSARRRAIGG